MKLYYTEQEIYDEILIPCMLERFRVTEEDLNPTVKFVEDLGLDSLDLTDLLCDIEERYGDELVNNDKPDTVNVYREGCTGDLMKMCTAIKILIEMRQLELHPRALEEDDPTGKEIIEVEFTEVKDDSKVS